MRFSYIIAAFAVSASLVSAANARDQLSLAGSSTVLPFATIIAEEMGKNPQFKTPVVESGGSSVGKKGVCEGIGTEYIDIGNASSRMKTAELEYCDANGVDLTEIKVGYDGIAVASSINGEQLYISKHDLGMALTAKVSACIGSSRNYNCDVMVDNPFQKWSDINASYPDIEIRVYGPPTTSGTRASFAFFCSAFLSLPICTSTVLSSIYTPCPQTLSSNCDLENTCPGRSIKRDRI